jgi:hypothetical protein
MCDGSCIRHAVAVSYCNLPLWVHGICTQTMPSLEMDIRVNSQGTGSLPSQEMGLPRKPRVIVFCWKIIGK